jgi:tetratricopeptide (TPR) repeat protein
MPESRPPRGLGGDDAAPTVGLADALRAVEPRVQLLAASVLIEAGALEAAWEPISEAAQAADDPLVREELGDQLLRLARGWECRRERHAAGGALRLAALLVPERAIPALARHLQKEGFAEEALALWAEAINGDPGEADHHLHYGRLLEALGRFQDAHAAYLRLVEEVPTASTALTVAPRLARLTALLPPAPEAVIRIAMLGSATLDQLRDCLIVQAHRAGMRPEIHLVRADRYAQEILDAGSDLHGFAPDLLILAIHRSRLFPELDDLPCRLSADERRQAIRSGLNSLRSLLRAFRKRSSAPVLLHNMVVPQHPLRVVADAEDELGQPDVFHRINLSLARLVSTEFRDVHLVDEDAVQARCGKSGATDPRLWLAARMPWSESLLMPLARELLRHLLACRGRARTCLVLGLDNTLWGGRVAEVGVEGVRLGNRAPGNAFLLFQQQIDRLWRCGLRLAACSRASRDDAVAVLETHPDMLVRMGHFGATRMGCLSKPDAVREIAVELDLTLESIVFWDNTPAERAQMRAALPQVLTPEVPVDPARHRQALMDLAVFDSLETREPR